MSVIVARTDLYVISAGRPAGACKGIAARERKQKALGKMVEKAKKSYPPPPSSPGSALDSVERG